MIQRRVNSASNDAKRPQRLVGLDLDGTCIDVRGSYNVATIRTVKNLSGRFITEEQVEDSKKKPGSGNIWRVSFALAFDVEPAAVDDTSERYRSVYDTFQAIYFKDRLWENDTLLIRLDVLRELARL